MSFMTTPRNDNQRPGHYAPYKAVENLPLSEECIPTLNEASIAQVVKPMHTRFDALTGASTARGKSAHAIETVPTAACIHQQKCYFS